MIRSPHRSWMYVLALAGTSLVAQVGGSKLPEYAVKARMLRSIGGYVAWPKTEGVHRSTFVIGVLGVSPFDRFLDEVTRDQMIQGRRLQVVYLRALTQSAAAACDVLFICDSEADRLPDILRICRGRPVLTVGDSPEFARRGVMLNLLINDGFVEPEVNLKAARAVGLEIGSSFLSLGKGKVKVVEGP